MFALIKTKCLPILFYGVEACPTNSSVRQAFEFTVNKILFKFAVFISPYSVAFGVILSLLFLFLFVCTVEDISTQDGAIGVKFWLRVEQTPGTGTR